MGIFLVEHQSAPKFLKHQVFSGSVEDNYYIT
jgi:hypothetical protein